MNYIVDHWRGRLSIGIAFWINLVGLRAVFLVLDQFFQPPYAERVDEILLPALAYHFVSLVLVLTWQVVGVVRATDRLAHRPGSSAAVFCAQIGVVVMLLPTGFSAFSTFQPLLIERGVEPEWVKRQHERAARYDISVSGDGRSVTVDGFFEMGLMRNLASVLDANPGVREVILESDGGFVIQGRAVATLIDARGLDTRIVGVCKSACAIAFMGGSSRKIHRSGKIGFHQYRFDQQTIHPSFNLREEYKKDSRYLMARGVNSAFVERIFEAAHEEIWFPTLKELVASGVVTELVDGKSRQPELRQRLFAV